MKPFEIPMLLTSLLTLCLLPGIEPPPLYADFDFGTPKPLGPGVNSSSNDFFARTSDDDLSLYFCRNASWDNPYEFWVSTRATRHDSWGVATYLGPYDDVSSYESVKSVPGVTTADGLEMLFTSKQLDGYGSWDIWRATRTSINAGWSSALNLGPTVNSTKGELISYLSADGLELYFSSNRPGGLGHYDIWVATRASCSDPWSEPDNLGHVVNSAVQDTHPSLSPDGLLLFFDSARPGGSGGILDLYVAKRATRSSPWGHAVNLGPMVNGPTGEEIAYISADGSTLFFDSDRPGSPGGHGIWCAPILPMVDFNGDGKVNGKDVVILMEHWGESDSVCDIGPYAWGDGIVDLNDVIALADYIGPELVDPTLVAHWALDEGAGSVAIDWVGEHYAMIVGDVVWEPNGVLGGALAFDGQENFMRTVDSILDPATGPLSVIAWVKGGAPNRVIVSQFGGADWLYLNQYGMLTTDLKASGQDGTSLTSDAWLLDDQWHRVALVWDGTNRALRVDGVEVAADTQPNLAASSGSLQIGTGKDRTADTFWSGLMDDIRVYRRATRP